MPADMAVSPALATVASHSVIALGAAASQRNSGTMSIVSATRGHSTSALRPKRSPSHPPTNAKTKVAAPPISVADRLSVAGSFSVVMA